MRKEAAYRLFVSLILCALFAVPASAQTTSRQFSFSRESIAQQGTWILSLSEFATSLANNMTASQPDKIEIIQLVRDNADSLRSIGRTMIDPTVSVSTAQSVGSMGNALKLFANTVDLGVAAQDERTRQANGSLSDLSSVTASLTTLANNLTELSADAQKSGNLNIQEYASQIRNAIFIFEAYQALQAGMQEDQTVTAKITSNQATEGNNTTQQVIVFDGSDSTDTGGTIDQKKGFMWDFGDGTLTQGPYVSHVYTIPNTYLVKLMVLGPSGFSIESSPVKIEPVYPVAIITTDQESLIGPTAEQLEIVVNEPVTFSATSSYDPSGSRNNLNFSWDFGDGNTAAGETARAVHHSFASPGQYTVILSVDNGTLTDADTKQIKVLPTLPHAAITLKSANTTEDEPAEKDFWTEVFVAPVTVELSATGSTGAPLEDANQRSRLLSFLWEFGDGSSVTQTPDNVRSGEDIRHTFDEPGTYILTLTVTDDQGLSHTATKYIHLSEPKVPRADFSATPWKQMTSDDVLRLDGTGSFAPQGSITTWSWEITDTAGSIIGNGSQSKMQQTFTKPGRYDVSLSVTSSLDSESPRVTQRITVLTNPPTADFEFSADPTVPNLVTFDASDSSDPDPGDSLFYSWDFDGDGSFDIRRDEEPVTKRVLDTVGDTNVTLEVVDEFNASDRVTKNVPVTSTLVAEMSVTASGNKAEISPLAVVGNVPLNVSVVGKGYHNLSTGTDSNEVQYYEWDFGDGSAQDIKSNVTQGKDTVSHRYSTPGTFALKLTVKDRNGKRQTSEVPITVGDGVNPIAVFTVRAEPPYTANTNTVFFFDASKSITARGTATNLSYSWDFGDGSPIERGATAQHVFSKTGNYTVTLSVIDNADKRLSKTTRSVTITDQAPLIRISVTPRSGTPPLRVSADGTGSNDPDGSIIEYKWDFGDGTIIRSTTNPKASHIYAEEGVYEVTLTITDENRVKLTSDPVIISVR